MGSNGIRAAMRLRWLRGRIERWRATRVKRSPMPAKLWREATELGRELGAYRVARELGIGYQSLRDRLGDDGGVEVRKARGFVEVDTASLFGLPPAAAGGEVELSDASGLKVVIRLGGGESVDVVALVAALRSAPR